MSVPVEEGRAGLQSRRAVLRRLAGGSMALAAGANLGASAPTGSVGVRVPRELVIATGDRGGVYFAYGEAYARAVRVLTAVNVLETAASVENLRLVGAGRAHVGFTLADSAALAVAGRPPFTGSQPIDALARLYDNYTHLVVRAEAPITTLADLRGGTVSTGAAGSGTELIAVRLLEATGLGPDDLRRVSLGLSQSANALAARRITGFFFSGGLPTQAISELAEGVPIRLVELGSYVPPLRARFGEFYGQLSIARATYGLSGDVTTVGVPNLLVVRADLDPTLAHALTRLLFAAKPRLALAHPEARRLNLRAAIATYPLNLHPGAVRYYRATKP